ncbi:MAG: SurA N-terminal domain-containing protein [Alphaproteobacteria bacterium]|nr:SurA N-terminal domain-containing protein [Alphaproteobacteria bacterium]
MLEYLRNASEKPVAKILIAVLAFSFVGWGVAEWIFGGTVGDNTLVTVGDTKISTNMYNAARSQTLASMSREEQREIYADPVNQQAFTARVLQSLTSQQMIQNRAEDMGFVVTDKRIAAEIRSYPEFQVNGEFSTFAFDTVLQSSGYSEADFAAMLRDNVLRSMTMMAPSAAISVPEFAVRAAYDARYGLREIEYVAVPYSEFNVGRPDDEDLRNYYAQNPQMVAETRSVSYVFIPAEMAVPDKYDAGYATAIKVEDDIIAGDSMSDVAKRHGAKYVSVPAFSRESGGRDTVLTDALINKVFDMDAGLESEMIETRDGFLFIRVDSVTPEHVAEFESVKSGLVNAWQNAERKKLAYVRANELLVDLNQTDKLAGGRVVTVSRTDGAPLEVLSDAFRNSVGQNAIVEGADTFYVLRVKNALPAKADTKRMSKIRSELSDAANKWIIDDYNSFLGREYPVKVNEKTYNRFFAN